MLKEWVFTEWEAVFAGLEDGKIVGMIYVRSSAQKAVF